MKPIKILKPELYSKFCSEWENRLTRKFPKGMPITRKNLEWVVSGRDYYTLLFGINSIIFRNDESRSWFLGKSWGWSSKKQAIALALEVAKTGKLTKAICKKAGIK